MSKECKWVWVEIEEFGDGNMQNSSYLKTKFATECSLLMGLYKYIPVSIHVEKQAVRWDSIALFLMGNIVHSWTTSSPFLTHRPQSLEAFSSCVWCEEAHPAALRELNHSSTLKIKPLFSLHFHFALQTWSEFWHSACQNGRGDWLCLLLLLLFYWSASLQGKEEGEKCSCLAFCEDQINVVQLPPRKSLPRWAPVGISIPILRTKRVIKENWEVKPFFFPSTMCAVRWLIARVRRCWYYNLKEHY